MTKAISINDIWGRPALTITCLTAWADEKACAALHGGPLLGCPDNCLGFVQATKQNVTDAIIEKGYDDWLQTPLKKTR